MLKYYNFGDSFVKWTTLFYKDAKSCITNNGIFSDFFLTSREEYDKAVLYRHTFVYYALKYYLNAK